MDREYLGNLENIGKNDEVTHSKQTFRTEQYEDTAHQTTVRKAPPNVLLDAYLHE